MPKSHCRENQGCQQQSVGPGGRNVPRPGFQHPGHNHQHPLAEHGGQTVESAPNPHEKGLFAFGEGQHIESVSGNVVGGTGEGGNPEQYENYRISLGRDRQSHQNETERNKDLHSRHPPSFGTDNIHEGTPQRLDDPGQIEKTGQQGHLPVGHTHTVEHNHGYAVHDKIRNSLCEIESGHPKPGREFFSRVFHLQQDCPDIPKVRIRDSND